ncbi:A24 family peptidase [Magnetovibrio sp.]|uniref:A24 family peptidase n=1 Tax=Magnetovibrio sp. TaxID=2024836 RepID=UPI002F91EF49
MTVLHSALMVSYIALVLYGAWSDARSLRIPNSVSLALLATFVPTALVAGLPLESIAWHLVCGVAVLVVGIVLFAFGLFGGGDAKLLAGCALWVGWPEVTWLVGAVILVGGALSILVILLRKGLGLWPDWLVNAAKGLFEPGKAVPYGIAISAGALLMLPRMDVLPPAWPDIFAFIVG